MDDFDCPPAMDWESFESQPGTLWTLRVPSEAVRWCGVNALCFGTGSLEGCFHPTADDCRVEVDTPEGVVVDTPQGLVRGLIRPEWVACWEPSHTRSSDQDSDYRASLVMALEA